MNIIDDKEARGEEVRVFWKVIIEFSQGDFKSEAVKKAILDVLPKNKPLGFRAVGESELESIRDTGLLGSQPENATLVQTETLYTTNFSTALLMFDGRQFGPTDSRHSGGYIVVFESKMLMDTDVASLDEPVPLAEIITFLKVDIILPDYSNPDLEDYENRISVSSLSKRKT